MKITRVLLVLSLATTLLPQGIALAQGPDEATDLNVWSILSTIIYGVIGIVLCILGYLAFDRLARLDLRRELVEDQNVALGIMLAGVFIGIAIVVASAIA